MVTGGADSDLRRADVVVVGGGPAGLASAIAIRLKGFEVTVLDPACPPIDKACGEGIPPAGVEALRQLGVRLAGHDAFALRGIRFLDRGCAVEAPFQHGAGRALRRTRLHEILAGRAAELGVRLLWGTHLLDRLRLASRQWIVGADGSHSRVRHAAGLDAARSESIRFGFRRHYRISPWTDFVEVYWGTRCQLYVTPVSRDEVGVALLCRDSHLRLDSALREFPDLERRLQGGRPCSAERGAVTVSRKLRRVFLGRTVLVGDASGSVDAITGEGLSLAFHQAVALSEALADGSLAQYGKEHARLSRRPAFVAGMLLALDRSAVLRRNIFRMMALDPQIFPKLLARCVAPVEPAIQT
jgi:flavin-dependent dehydrogenase